MDTPTNTDTDDYENYADLIYENWRDIQEQDALEKQAKPKPAPFDASTRVRQHKNDKQCMKCGVYRPIRHFAQPRHRLCLLCRADSVMPAVERAAANYAAQPPRPLPPVVPKSGDAWMDHKNMTMEYARQRRADKDARDRAMGKPVKTPVYRSIKYCVRCKSKKPTIQFDHPRDRICLSCYSPNG